MASGCVHPQKCVHGCFTIHCVYFHAVEISSIKTGEPSPQPLVISMRHKNLQTREATDRLVHLPRICISLKSAWWFKERDAGGSAGLIIHAVDTQQGTRPDFPLGLGQVPVACSYPLQPPGGTRTVFKDTNQKLHLGCISLLLLVYLVASLFCQVAFLWLVLCTSSQSVELY